MPMVFQHGLCGDAAQPAEVFPFDLPGRCLTLECRGHGASEPGDDAGFSIAAFAEDIAAWIETLGLAPLAIGGISMGAAIALRLAVTRPDLVRALVLARPAWVTEAAPANMAPNAVVGDLLARFPADEARRRFEALDLVRDLEAQAPDNLASLRGFFARSPQPVTAALLSRISRDGPGVTRAAVAALAVPTLVIGHARDAVHPLSHAEALAALIPAARLVRITPKAESRELYRRDFSAALAQFLLETAP
ncbi:alpha/beta fold hydrolase [Labrys monachus]|nr:alpha/beta fold hydrolase [Labrys monachus]